MGDEDGEEIGAAEGGTLIEQRFAENLRKYRDDKGMSQTALAEAMAARGWPWRQQTVARLESGRRMVRFGEAADVAEILGVTLDRLVLPSAEAGEVAMVDNAAVILRRAWAKASEALERLYSARAVVERVLEGTQDSEYGRTQEASLKLAARLRTSTPGSAVDEGYSRFERTRGGEGRDRLAVPTDEAVVNTDHPSRRQAALFGPRLSAGTVPAGAVRAAVTAAVALYAKAAMETITPEDLAGITSGLSPDIADEIVVMIAEVAAAHRDPGVLRHIRAAGLERLAIEGLAREWALRAGQSADEMEEFYHSLRPLDRSSVRDQVIQYIEDGGTDWRELAALVAAQMTPGELAMHVSHREDHPDLTGIGRTTIDRILAPPAPGGHGDRDGA